MLDLIAKDVMFEIGDYLCIFDLVSLMRVNNNFSKLFVRLYTTKKDNRYKYLTAILSEYKLILPSDVLPNVVKLYDRLELVKLRHMVKEMGGYVPDYYAFPEPTDIEDLQERLDKRFKGEEEKYNAGLIDESSYYISLMTSKAKYYYSDGDNIYSITLGYDIYAMAHIRRNMTAYDYMDDANGLDYSLFDYYTEYVTYGKGDNSYLKSIGAEIYTSEKEVIKF